MIFFGSCQSAWVKITERKVSMAAGDVLFGDDSVVDTLSSKSMRGTV